MRSALLRAFCYSGQCYSGGARDETGARLVT